MAIPDTEVRLFKGIPWDSDYEDVRLFEDAAERDSYFKDSGEHFVRKFTDFTYQRIEGRDSVRVGIHADKIRNVNYIGFKNSTLNKWFYAFVDSIEYINQNCTEIFYTLDHFQNWFYAVTADKGMPPCQLLRRHSTNEEESFASTPNTSVSPIFTSPEKLTPSVYMANEEQTDTLLINNDQFSNLHIYISVILSGLADEYNQAIILMLGEGEEDPEKAGQAKVDLYKTVLGGNEYKAYRSISSGSLWQFKMSSNTQLSDYRKLMHWLAITPATYSASTIATDSLLSRAVIASYLSPVSYKDGVSINEAKGGTIITSKKCKLNPKSLWGTGGGNEDYGYMPTNNKLKFYPYRKIIVQSFSGQGEEIQPEYFYPTANGLAQFDLKVTPLVNPRITLRPMFRGVANDTLFIDFFCENEVSYMDNPVGLAIKKGTQFDPLLEAYRAGSGIVKGYIEGGSGNALMNVAKQALGRMSSGIEGIQSSNYQPTTVYGNNGSSDNAWLYGNLGFLIYPVSSSWQEGKNIDKYFDRYGYNATGETSSPLDVLHNRQLWDYVQTAECIVTSNIPQDSKKMIEAIFNAGTRLWHTEPKYDINERNLCVGQAPPQPSPDPVQDPTLVMDNLYIPSSKLNIPSQDFDVKNPDIEGTRNLHCGTDYGISIGEELHPICSGKVVLADTDDSRGNYIVIEHTYDFKKDDLSPYKTYRFYSIYMHLGRMDVTAGDSVDRKTIIGTSGQSGQVEGPHLHLGIYAVKDGENADIGAGYLHNTINRPGSWLHDEFHTSKNYYIDFEDVRAGDGSPKSYSASKMLPILVKAGILTLI